jgi:hypothetical protein
MNAALSRIMTNPPFSKKAEANHLTSGSESRWDFSPRRPVGEARRPHLTSAPSATQSGPHSSPFKKSFLVGDEVTSLKFLRFLKNKSETPYVVSYFFNGLIDGVLAEQLFNAQELIVVRQPIRAA